MKDVFTSSADALRQSHVLAVEDSMVQAKMLQRFFNEHEIKSKLFSNAFDAYESAVSEPPVLIISDIVMPGMDGYEFCLRIKNNPDLRDIPVILLTSLRDPLDIVKGLQAGADNFITKPYDEEYLLSRIHYLLANRDMRRSGVSDTVMEIVFQGNKYQINSDKKQILNLLLSVYEAAIIRNNELIEAKQQLEELNRSLKEANEELDAFARTVSHDLRSPLSGIIGFTQLAIDDLSAHFAPEMTDNLKWVMTSAFKMSDLINDLLNFSRSSRSEINAEPLNLSRIAIEVVEDICTRNPGLSVKFNIGENLTVKADQSLMRIALTNLLGNAVKYSGKSADPEVTFGSTELYGQRVFFVKDNGAGFDMAKAGKLFDPFVRLHSSNEFAGTGVGLSTVKRILFRQGGDIWAESEPGKGATFFFTIRENS